MSFDAHSNFGYSTVAVAPSPAATGTSLQVQTGHGALYPTAPFNCTVWPAGVQPLASNAEIVRVTAVVGDVLTIVRAQEGTAAINIATGYQIANTTSVKVFTDIQNSIIQFVSAGTTKASATEIEFGNANGVTFGVDGQTITASVNAGGVVLSAGTSSQGTGTIIFSNSNGITFGLDNGTLTATHNALTSQSAQVASASNGSFTFQTLSFGDAGNIHMGTSAGGIIFASLVAALAAGTISAGTTHATLGGVSFVNSNGITFGLSSNSITASHNGLTSQSNQAASASNGSFTFQTLNFSNANNVTFGTSAGGIITASIAPPGAGSVNFSAGTESSNLASIVFSNSNGVSFGLSNGTITASASGGGNNLTLSYFPIPMSPQNNSSWAGYVGINNRFFLDPFIAPHPITFNSVQLVASIAMNFSSTGTISEQMTIEMAIYSRSVTDSAATNFSNSNIIVSYLSQQWTFTCFMSASSASSKTLSAGWQTDSTGGSTSSSVSTSNSGNIAFPNWAGRILFGIPFGGLVKAGENWIGMVNSVQFAGQGNTSNQFAFSFLRLSFNGNSTNKSDFGDTGAGNVNGNNMWLPGLGVYQAATDSPPSSIHLVNDISNSGGNQEYRYYLLKA